MATLLTSASSGGGWRRSRRGVLAVTGGIALAVAAGCDPASHIGKQRAAEAIVSSNLFRAPKFAYIPRVLSVQVGSGIPGSVASSSTRAGELFGLDQIAEIDAAVAVLQARGRVQVEDFMNPVQTAAPAPIVEPPPLTPAARSPGDTTSPRDTTAPPPAPASPSPPPPVAVQDWVHTLRITPRAELESNLLSADDGDDGDLAPMPTNPSLTHFGRSAGWKLSIGTRELVKVLEIHGARDEGVQAEAGEAVVDFLWRWRPTAAGDAFDGQGPEFQSLPESVRRAANTSGLRMDTAQPQWSRAILHRGAQGWVVKTVDWKYGEGRTLVGREDDR